MAKKNPAVLWNVDQTGDVIGAEGRTTAQGNVGLGNDFVKSSKTSKKYVTHVSRKSDGTLQVNVEQPSLSDLQGLDSTTQKNMSIVTAGDNDTGITAGTIIAKQLAATKTSSQESDITFVSDIAEDGQGNVSFTTKPITRATDDTAAQGQAAGITSLLTTTYASYQPVDTITDAAVTPKGLWNAIKTLDVDNLQEGDAGYDEHKSHITGFGADKTLATLTETDGKISATFQSIAIDGTAITLGAASQAVVTDGNQHLTTQDLSNVTSSAETNPTSGYTYVSSISQTKTGQVSYKTQTLAVATDANIGGIKTGFTDDNANRKYAVDVVDSGTGKDTAFVQVPLASVYNTATPANTYAGLVKSSAAPSLIMNDRYYDVEIKSDATMKVHVNWINTNWDMTSFSHLPMESITNANTGERRLWIDLNIKQGGGLAWVQGDETPELAANNIIALTHTAAGDREDPIYKLVIDTDWNILYNNSSEIGIFAPVPQPTDDGKMVVVSGDILAYEPIPAPGTTVQFGSSTTQGPSYAKINELTIWSGDNRVSATTSGGSSDAGYLPPYIDSSSVTYTKVYAFPYDGAAPDWVNADTLFTAGTDLKYVYSSGETILRVNTNGNDHKANLSYPFVTGYNTEVTSSYGFAGGIGSVAGGINVHTEYIEDTGEYITYFDPALSSAAGYSSRFAMGKNCLVSMADSFALGFDNKVLDTKAGRSEYYEKAASGAFGYSNYIENAYHAITIGGNNHVLPNHHGTILIGENLESDGSARIIMGTGNESTQHVGAIRVTGTMDGNLGVNLEELSYSGTLWLREGLLTTKSVRNSDMYTREIWLRTYNRVPFLTRPYYLAEYWNPEVSEYDNQSDVSWGRSSVKYPSDTSSYFYIRDHWTDSGLKREMEVSSSLYSSELLMNRSILATSTPQGNIMRGLQIRVDASGIFLSNNLLSDTNLSNTTPYTNSSYIAIGHIPGNGGMISQNTQWTSVALHSYLGVYTNEYDGATHAANTAGIPAPVRCSSLILKVIPVSTLTTMYSSNPVIVPSYIEGECVLIYGDVVGGQYVQARTGLSYTGFNLPYDKCVLACTVQAKTSTSEGRVAVTWWAVS